MMQRDIPQVTGVNTHLRAVDTGDMEKILHPTGPAKHAKASCKALDDSSRGVNSKINNHIARQYHAWFPAVQIRWKVI